MPDEPDLRGISELLLDADLVERELPILIDVRLAGEVARGLVFLDLVHAVRLLRQSIHIAPQAVVAR